jgi:hypothetical protein
LNLRNFPVFNFCPAVRYFHSPTCVTAAYSCFINFYVFRREIIKLFHTVYYLLFTLMFSNELPKKIYCLFCVLPVCFMCPGEKCLLLTL